MATQTLIISDTHLAGRHTQVQHPESLRPLWKSGDRLIINGDCAEVHHPVRRGEAARQILFLQTLCERDGVELTLLSGNHDAFISDTRHLSLAGGQVFVTHGDVFHPEIAPWSRGAAIMRQEMQQALAALSPEERADLHARLEAAQHAAHAEWVGPSFHDDQLLRHILDLLLPPTRLVKLLHYWKNIATLANRFVVEHAAEARFVVFGHTHRQGIWQFDERTVINTGGFAFPARPRAVVLEAGELSVWPIQSHGGHFRLGRRPLRQFGLEAGPLRMEPAAAEAAA